MIKTLESKILIIFIADIFVFRWKTKFSKSEHLREMNRKQCFVRERERSDWNEKKDENNNDGRQIYRIINVYEINIIANKTKEIKSSIEWEKKTTLL